jgi:hypothetical protein
MLYGLDDRDIGVLEREIADVEVFADDRDLQALGRALHLRT